MKKIGVGIIGCGTISETYLKNLTEHFDNVEVLACADMFPEKAEQTKEKFNLPKACTVKEILADPDISIIANLTIPSAHYEVNMQILEAGKNVYCEKPLALSLQEAEKLTSYAAEKNLIIGSAPDTFLGAGLQTCRKLIDDDAIGTVIGFTANLVSPGHELWHPAPHFYYKTGGGPMLDMGPYYLTALVTLLGPIKQLSCFAKASRTERPIQGQMFKVEVPTHYAGIVEMNSGVIGNVNMSFDVWDSDLPLLEIYGTKGVMRVPDPNLFNGNVSIFNGEKMAEIVSAVEGAPFNRIVKMHTCKDECLMSIDLLFPQEDTERSNMRGFGIADMAQAIIDNRPSRIAPDVSMHIVEALTAFDYAAQKNEVYKMKTTCQIPEPMPLGLNLWEVK